MIDNSEIPLTIHVRNREGILFEGTILSLTGINQKGTFDILSLHSNFVTLVEQKIVLKTPEGKVEEIEVKSGVLRVIENHIEVYLGFLN